MAISKTDLINKALTLVGANPITNIDDDTNNARIVNRVYEIALRSILSECKWNFATKRHILAQSAETLEWYYTGEGEAYIYARPTDVIRIFGTNDDNATWREEGDLILSDTSGLGITYVYYLDNPDKYTSSFIEALIDKLCSDIAFMIINSASTAQTFLAKYEKVSLPKALSENAQVGKHQYLKDDAWVNSMTQNGSVDS
jgi:hypothetical protein